MQDTTSPFTSAVEKVWPNLDTLHVVSREAVGQPSKECTGATPDLDQQPPGQPDPLHERELDLSRESSLCFESGHLVINASADRAMGIVGAGGHRSLTVHGRP